MKIQKIQISKDKLNTNFKFYLFLKELNGTIIKLTDNDIKNLLETYFTNLDFNTDKLLSAFRNQIDNYKKEEKKNALESLLFEITNDLELQIFIFALRLLQIKPLLLAEAKLEESVDLFELNKLNQLSIKYDTYSKSNPYFTRVNGALLSLLFFKKLEEKQANFISLSTEKYITFLFQQYEFLKDKGIEANQIFMLMFTESMNQSIISNAGSNYEDRIYNILIGLGIKAENIKKTHDKSDRSTEFDFYFEFNNKTFGIGAKRTLRERYKQFIKTALMTKIDIMIQITLGLDLTENTAITIIHHGVILIVADEIYNSRKYLQANTSVYPASQLNNNLLMKLSNL